MPRYRVNIETVETVRRRFYVDAASKAEAERIVDEERTSDEGDWVETVEADTKIVSVEEL